MSKITRGKGTMPKSLDLNGQAKKYDEISSDCIGAIRQDVERTGTSEKVARARRTLLIRLAVSRVDKEPFCLIWDIPDGESVVSPGLFRGGEKVFELRGDSLLFQELCLREKISGEETLPIVVRSCFPNRGIYVDVEKYKKIKGIKE